MLLAKNLKKLEQTANQERQKSQKREEKERKKRVQQSANTSPATPKRKNTTKRGARYQQLKRIRPFLNAEFKNAVKQLRESNVAINDYAKELEGFVRRLIKGDNAPFQIEIVDADKASNAHDFYWTKRHLIINGTSCLTGSELQKYDKDALEHTGENGNHLSKCFNRDNIIAQLKAVLPAHEITLQITYSDKKNDHRPKILRVRIQGCDPKNPKISIGVSDKRKTYHFHMRPLTDTSFQEAVNHITKWSISVSPDYRDQMQDNLNKMRHAAIISERHKSVYGHDRLVVADDASLDERKASLAQRLSFMQNKHQIK